MRQIETEVVHGKLDLNQGKITVVTAMHFEKNSGRVPATATV